MNTFKIKTLSFKVTQNKLTITGKNGVADDVRLDCTQNTAKLVAPFATAEELTNLKDRLRTALQDLENL